MAAKIRKGDLVEVISGASQDRGGDRGKQGQVLEVLVKENRVIVEGVNYVKKHTRVGQTQRGGKTGGIETVEAPIHVSNVAVVDPETKRAARVGFKVEEVDGKLVRTRYFKPSRRAAAKPAKAEKAAKADKAEKAEKPAKSKKKDAE